MPFETTQSPMLESKHEKPTFGVHTTNSCNNRFHASNVGLQLIYLLHGPLQMRTGPLRSWFAFFRDTVYAVFIQQTQVHEVPQASRPRLRWHASCCPALATRDSSHHAERSICDTVKPSLIGSQSCGRGRRWVGAHDQTTTNSHNQFYIVVKLLLVRSTNQAYTQRILKQCIRSVLSRSQGRSPANVTNTPTT